MNINELKSKSTQELVRIGGDLEVEGAPDLGKDALVERIIQRQVERGGHAVVVIDALDGLPPSARRRLFGAGRATEEGGTLTVLAATGEDREPLRWATTRIVLEPGGRVAAGESGTLHADRLA